MHITTLQNLKKRKASDLLIIPVALSKEKLTFGKETEEFKKEFDSALKTDDFHGKEGEWLLHYPHLKGLEPRVALLGLGEEKEITVESLRRAFSSALKNALKLKCRSITVAFPPFGKLTDMDRHLGAFEGLLLTNYRFDQLKAETLLKDPSPLVEKICFVTDFSAAEALFEKTLLISEGVYMARDLVNGNADTITPEFLAKVALGIAKEHPSKIKTTVFKRKELEKLGMGLLLAVGRGSHHEPHLIILEYAGDPSHASKKTVLVGKGVTYDTGGLNLKPTGGIETMKCDMGGAAACLASVSIAAALKLKVNVTAVIPATENSIDALSYKPGDVYRSFAKKTVEIGNTDAEGRLILADALAYTVAHLKPSEIIDVATLTGAIDIALGNEASGLFSNNDELAEQLILSGEKTFERVWRMPLFKEYRELLKSDIADIKNHGGRSGGAITAAHFLHDFVGETPWAHLDVASTAFLAEPKRYHPKHATGTPARLLVQFLERKSKDFS